MLLASLKVDFYDTNDEFEEDYWFALTEKGKSKLDEKLLIQITISDNPRRISTY